MLNPQQNLAINDRLYHLRAQQATESEKIRKYEQMQNQIAQNTREVALAYINDEILFLEKLTKL